MFCSTDESDDTAPVQKHCSLELWRVWILPISLLDNILALESLKPLTHTTACTDSVANRRTKGPG